MTPEERACAVVRKVRAEGVETDLEWGVVIQVAIEAAVAEEREACAALCECVLGVCSGDETEYWEGHGAAAKECARAIRARSEP